MDTDPQPLFEEIQADILSKGGYDPIWLSCAEHENLNEFIESILMHELTPDLAVSLALLNNRKLQATYENLKISKAQLAQAGLMRNPIFSLAYLFSTNPSVTALIETGLFQNFLEALLIPLKKRMAMQELEATMAMVRAQIFDVIAQTKIAFYAYQALTQIWELKQQILLGAESSYEVARKLFEAGNLKELEVTAHREFYEQTKIELASLEVEIFEAREQLNIELGLWEEQINWKAQSCLPRIQKKELEWNDVEASAIANSLELEMAKRQIYRAAAGYGIDTTHIILPQLDIGPAAEREEGVWYVGPAVAFGIPFFDFGKAISAAAQAEILRQWNIYTALAIEIRSTARLKRAHLLNAHRQALYYQRVLIPISEQLTSLTLLQHNAMQLGVFHLLAAKLHELEQKIQSVKLEREYWIAHTELELLLNGHFFGKHL